jgi:ABC-type bacteriocin/lantibiotic exporter with double-glycine peptidase domain
MIKLPYFKQDTEYSCGPTVMRMIFQFYGKVFSEKKLIQRLKTNKDIGTRHKAMIDLACAEGFHVYVNKESSFEEIRFFNNKNIPVIVYYVEPDGDDEHYAIVVDIEEDQIVLNDPWNGERFKMNHDDFEKRWYSKYENLKRWIMVISDEEQSLPLPII